MWPCPFTIGQQVTWIQTLPNPSWRYTITPGPMVVVDATWCINRPSDLALLFGPNGFEFEAGWRITVEYDADSTDYYDPPLSIILGRKRLTGIFHETWLQAIEA